MDKETIRKIFDIYLDDLDKIILENPKYIKAKKESNKFEKELEKQIGKDGYKKFESFMDKYFAVTRIENEEFFIQGFSLANKLRDESLMK